MWISFDCRSYAVPSLGLTASFEFSLLSVYAIRNQMGCQQVGMERADAVHANGVDKRHTLVFESFRFRERAFGWLLVVLNGAGHVILAFGDRRL